MYEDQKPLQECQIGVESGLFMLIFMETIIIISILLKKLTAAMV